MVSAFLTTFLSGGLDVKHMTHHLVHAWLYDGIYMERECPRATEKCIYFNICLHLLCPASFVGMLSQLSLGQGKTLCSDGDAAGHQAEFLDLRIDWSCMI